MFYYSKSNSIKNKYKCVCVYIYIKYLKIQNRDLAFTEVYS